ncbi:Protein of unknown function (DUF3421) [Popillia japonica]|uniref:Uncharacterized protein n=1 Tax=Popillia japonica TaxID=7064 RepID=A0AAW1IW46_POPJA
MFKTFLVLCVISTDTILNTGNAVQDFYWRDYAHGIIPDDAFEGKPGIYIGQAYFKNGGLLPAAIYPHTNAAVAIYDTRQDIKEYIKILCSRDRRKFYWGAINFTNNDDGDLANAVKTEIAVTQDFYWRDYSHGELPIDALEGGIGKYIGQVYYAGQGLLPATIYPHRNVAFSIYGGRLSIKEHIKILCTNQPKKFYWSRVNFNDSVDPVMKDAVKGGFQNGYNLFIGTMNHEDPVMKDAVKGGFQDGYNLFIGTMNHEGENKIGKVVGVDDHKSKGLYVWDKDGTKILCTPQPGNFYWETVDFNTDNVTMMKDAVVGGFQETYIEVKDWKADLIPNFYWRDYNHGHVPRDALEAAPGLYIGQAHFSDGLFPVAIYPYRNSAVAVYGQRRDVTNHKIMLLMKDAVMGGFEQTSLAYIGLVGHLGNWKVGKVFDMENAWRGIYVWGNDGSRAGSSVYIFFAADQILPRTASFIDRFGGIYLIIKIKLSVTRFVSSQ